jgi:hypothetical protein
MISWQLSRMESRQELVTDGTYGLYYFALEIVVIVTTKLSHQSVGVM